MSSCTEVARAPRPVSNRSAARRTPQCKRWPRGTRGGAPLGVPAGVAAGVLAGVLPAARRPNQPRGPMSVALGGANVGRGSPRENDPSAQRSIRLLDPTVGSPAGSQQAGARSMAGSGSGGQATANALEADSTGCRTNARIRAPNSGSVLWGCVVSTGLSCLETRAEVPSGLVKQAAKRSNCQQAACSRPRRLGGKVSMEAASPSRAVEVSLSEGATPERSRTREPSPI